MDCLTETNSKDEKFIPTAIAKKEIASVLNWLVL